MNLRPYQQDGLARILDAYKRGARSVLAVLPTGGGKTQIFTTLARQVPQTLINVHRRELATQAARRLTDLGVDFGYIMAGEPRRPWAPVQIASVQTLVRRELPPARLVINDEAHLSTAATWAKIMEGYPSARILGVTATPWRLSGKPLAGTYDECVVIATPAELCAQGWLCPFVGFSYRAPDLSEVRKTGADYNEKDTALAMRQGLIVDNIVEQYGKHARDLSAVCFAVTVEHSRELADKFRGAGVSAEHLDGATPHHERAAILARVERGETRVLCNVGVAVEGLDIPRLKCCILARPTLSLARAIQMQGRVRRPWQGVTARIHDHAFVISQHGLPDQDRDYDLTTREARPPSLTTCEECLAMYAGPRCPNCAHENAPSGGGPATVQVATAAEEFEISSDTVIERPPVRVNWRTPGKSVEGIFERTWEESTEWGSRKVYELKGKRNYHLPGTAHLDALLNRAPRGRPVRVTYLGDQSLPGGKMRKQFRVEVDDGKDDEPHPVKKVKPPMWLKRAINGISRDKGRKGKRARSRQAV